MNSNFFTDLDPDVYKTIVLIFVLILAMRFILLIINKLLDHKLKNRIIEKEVTEDLANALLNSDKNNQAINSIKWFLLLMSTGIGLFITKGFLPLGIHSFAIMATSISAGFLAHSFYLKKYQK